MIRVHRAAEPRLCQGDIIRDVEWIESAVDHAGTVEISKIVFPLVVVLTQDCDLARDYQFRAEDRTNEDKWLISILVAPLYNAEYVYSGDHLDQLEIHMQPVPRSGTRGNNLRNNQTPRFHYLEFPADVPIVPQVIDFKHYFSVGVRYLCEAKERGFVCKVDALYREDVSHRFASFLARIGLPEPGE